MKDVRHTFNTILKSLFDTAEFGSPRPKRVATISKIENIVANSDASIMRAIVVSLYVLT
jgi:hypothetical protein